jgi:hypothetical protein
MGISGLALGFWFARHAHDEKTNRELYIQAVFAIWLAHSSSAVTCIDFFTKAFS